MRYRRIAGLATVLVIAACSEAAPPTQPENATAAPNGSRMSLQGSTVHIMPPRGSSPVSDVGAQATGILYHGGPILPVTNVAAIYWANNTIYAGGPAPGTNGAGSGDGSVVGYFISHFGGSPYFNINTTYFDQVGGGHTVTNTVNYTQFWADNTGVPPANGSTVTNGTIQNEIIKGFNTGKLTYDPATVYAVFTAGNTNLGGGFGSQYCAYHGRFTWNSPQGAKKVIFAAQPFAFQFPSGCSNGTASPNNDPAADAVINVLAHEIEEATTDYDLNAWFDNAGAENADKCAWTFGTTYNNGTGIANMKLGTRDFLIQQNWVNAGNGGCLLAFGGGNQSPVAAFTWTCNPNHSCTFDGTSSSDPDGTIASYKWQRGNGPVISTQPVFTRQFPGARTIQMKLTVTDNGGATNTVTHAVAVP